MIRKSEIISLALIAAFVSATPMQQGAAQEKATPRARVNQVIVDAIASASPDSPVALMRAVQNLANISEFELANQYLSKAIAMRSSDAELAAMVDELGSPLFIGLSLKSRLQPQMEQYTRRVFDAANRVMQDPARMKRWVRQLTDKTVDRQLEALNKLRDAGPHGAAAILADLSDDDSQLDKKRLEAAMFSFGRAAQPVLVAGLRSGKAATRRHSMRILARQPLNADGDLIPDLLKPCCVIGVDATLQQQCSSSVSQAIGSRPSRDMAREYLADRIQRLLDPDSQVLPTDIDGQSSLWVWQSGGLQRRSYPQQAAQLIRATQLATDLFAIDDASSLPRLLFAATQLGSAKLAGGIQRPLQTQSAGVRFVTEQYSPEELETVLSFCLEQDLVTSAVATIEILAEVGSEKTLGYDASRAALSNALNYPNRRVQFAAAQAIVQLGPTQPFGGAENLVKVLTRFAASTGGRRALIVHPIRNEADLIAGAFTQLGFAADIVTGGKQALDCLQRKSDYDLILVGDAVSSPKWSELVQQLHHQARQIPICIMVRDINLNLAFEVTSRYDRMHVFPTPFDAQSLNALLRHVLPASIDLLSASERHDYALESLELLANLAERWPVTNFLELGFAEPTIIVAMSDPRRSRAAIQAAGFLGTPELQAVLLNAASDASRPGEDRTAAISALNTAIERHGLLLTHPQLATQYQRFNQAIDVQADDTVILGQLLDTIEKPSGRSSR